MQSHAAACNVVRAAEALAVEQGELHKRVTALEGLKHDGKIFGRGLIYGVAIFGVLLGLVTGIGGKAALGALAKLLEGK